MELFEQSVVAFFAAVGIAWAAWSIAEALFLSKREKLERCLVLIPAAYMAMMIPAFWGGAGRVCVGAHGGAAFLGQCGRRAL